MLRISTGCPVLSTTTARNSASRLSSTSGSLGKEALSSRGVLKVDVAGGSEVQLISVCELHLLGLITCEGCDIVHSDHAPQAGVAQGIFDGELVRRRVGHQVELEGKEQDEEVERRVRRDAQRTTHRCACMDDME